MKLYALGFSRYLSERYYSVVFLKDYTILITFSWNQLDVSIVVMSIIGIGLEEIEGQVSIDSTSLAMVDFCIRFSLSIPPSFV